VLQDTDASVREDVIEALRLMRRKKAWGGLVEATKDSNFRVRSAAMDALREVTKQKIEHDPKAWQDWWAKHKDDAEPDEQPNPKESSPKFKIKKPEGF